VFFFWQRFLLIPCELLSFNLIFFLDARHSNEDNIYVKKDSKLTFLIHIFRRQWIHLKKKYLLQILLLFNVRELFQTS